MNAQINKLFLLLFMAVMMFTSCQKENIEEINPNEDNLVTATSEVAFLVANVTTWDGSYDNILDRNHCTSVVLPVTVVVRDIQVVVDSEEDLEVIEGLFDEFEDDIDELDFIFPITLVLANHTEVVLENADQLENIIAECAEDDDDIECVDFEYPITIAVYNDNNEQTGSETFENDEQLYRFFKELKENEFVSFNFPMTLIDSTGEKVVIENNEQLAQAIRTAKNECDEDDDDDYNDDDFSLERLNGYLVECPWVVKDVEINDVDLTEDYFEYKLDFKEDGSVIATRVVPSSAVVDGAWTTSLTDHGALLSLDFGANDILTNQWLVYDIGEGRIKFYDENSRVRLTQRCVDGDVVEIKGYMIEGSWIVADFAHTSLDTITEESYTAYTFTFNEDGTMIATNSNTEVKTGNWAVYRNDLGKLRFKILEFAQPDLLEILDGDFFIVATRADRLELVAEYETSSKRVVFEKQL